MEVSVIDQIPVANLLRLAYWAGVPLEVVEECEASHEDGAGFHELLVHLLAGAIEQLRRSGFERGYSSAIDCGTRPRGRILLAESISRASIARGQLVHEHDLFDVDTLDNRVLKAAALTLLQYGTLDTTGGPVAPANTGYGVLLAATRDMRSVRQVDLTRSLMAQLPRRQSARRYRTVRFVARVLVEYAEPDAGHGIDWAQQLAQDPVRMRRVFERFVLRYAKVRAARGVKVSRTTYHWSDVPSTAEACLMPTLQTDVVLHGQGWTRIVECKYTRTLLQANHHGTPRLRNEHLRQVHSYLSRHGRPHGHVPSGLLLYPAAQTTLDIQARMGDFPVRVATLDLRLPWSTMCAKLSQLLYE